MAAPVIGKVEDPRMFSDWPQYCMEFEGELLNPLQHKITAFGVFLERECSTVSVFEHGSVERFEVRARVQHSLRFGNASAAQFQFLSMGVQNSLRFGRECNTL